MQLIFHGGGQEVGRSCIEVRAGNDRYLLDCGLKFHAGGIDYPAKVFDSRTIDAVFLSHAHLDHSGGLPFFEHYKMACPIFATPETQSIVKVLLKDSQRIGRMRHLCEAFTTEDMKKVFKDERPVTFNKPVRFRNITYTFYNAGHIPGSASVKIEGEGVSVLYTGDYNNVGTQLMQPADPHVWGKVDVLITESTYGNKEHPDRKRLEHEFLLKVDEVLQRGGRVLVPVFAVGRAQEILVTLGRREWPVPVYMDGMAKRITNIILREKNPYVKHRSNISQIYKGIKRIKNPKQRADVADGPGIYVTTSGMLQGGPAMTYLEHIWNDPKSAILLTGYQVKNTNGWHLIEEDTVRIDGRIRDAKCEVAHFDFSAHLSRTGIQETIKAVDPRIVVFVHGAPPAIRELADWTQENSSAEIYAPKVGDQIDIPRDGSTSRISLYTTDDGFAFPREHQHGEECVAYDDFD